MAFTLVSLLIVVAVGVGHWGMQRQHDINVRMDQLEQVKDDIQTFAYHVADITGWQGLVVADAGAYGGKVAVGPEGYNRKGELESKKALFETLDTTRVEYLTEAERAQFDKLRPAWENFFVEDDKIMELLAEDTREARVKALDSINGGPAGEAWGIGVKISTALRTSIDQRITALEKEIAEVESTGERVLYATLALALLAAAVLSVLSTRSVVRPLNAVVDALGRVAGGDLTARLGLKRRDELGRLADALDATTDALRTTVASVVAHSDTLAAPPPSCRRWPSRSRPRPRRPAPSPEWWPRRPPRSPSTWRSWPPAARRWARPSRRSPTAPARRPRWPPRR
ncbi:HAMP domain-containing protein [Planobispora longispora]|uniref:HAMP domain-containing protein n=2 Tax=Planobispora longispora TaxID=28887 RepID=UPI003605B431